jgi:8-oxo-dGTP diphosphatase
MVRGSSLILLNGKRELLLQLRDNKPGIMFPNCWSTFGGHLRKRETPFESIQREALEELDYLLVEPQYVGNIPYQGHDCFVFMKIDPHVCLRELQVNEGQGAAFFSEEDAGQTGNWAFNTREIVETCFKKLLESDST